MFRIIESVTAKNELAIDKMSGMVFKINLHLLFTQNIKYTEMKHFLKEEKGDTL